MHAYYSFIFELKFFVSREGDECLVGHLRLPLDTKLLEERVDICSRLASEGHRNLSIELGDVKVLFLDVSLAESLLYLLHEGF